MPLCNGTYHMYWKESVPAEKHSKELVGLISEGPADLQIASVVGVSVAFRAFRNWLTSKKHAMTHQRLQGIP